MYIVGTGRFCTSPSENVIFQRYFIALKNNVKDNKDSEDSKDNVIRLISWAFIFFDKTFEFPRHAPCLLIHTRPDRESQLAKCINIKQFPQLQSKKCNA